MKAENKYNRDIVGLDGTKTIVDVYRVLSAFNVVEPELQHAIKKLLCLGIRGKGDEEQDLNEAILSLEKMKERLWQEKGEDDTVCTSLRDWLRYRRGLSCSDDVLDSLSCSAYKMLPACPNCKSFASDGTFCSFYCQFCGCHFNRDGKVKSKDILKVGDFSYFPEDFFFHKEKIYKIKDSGTLSNLYKKIQEEESEKENTIKNESLKFEQSKIKIEWSTVCPYCFRGCKKKEYFFDFYCTCGCRFNKDGKLKEGVDLSKMYTLEGDFFYLQGDFFKFPVKTYDCQSCGKPVQVFEKKE